MATSVIMPALEMAQESGKLLQWLKHAGDAVTKGEPIMEIETDKVTVEIEAPASGILGGVTAGEGESVPVGQTIAWVLGPGEAVPAANAPLQSGRTHATPAAPDRSAPPPAPAPASAAPAPVSRSVTASPVAAQIAREHGIDLAAIKPVGGRVDKADVLAFLQTHPSGTSPARAPARQDGEGTPLRTLASPKARRLAAERAVDISAVRGSGPGGAVLAADVESAVLAARSVPVAATRPAGDSEMTTVWRVMAERMTASWTTVPHFYLIREVEASALAEMRRRILPAVEKRSGIKPTYSDLLVKLVAVALRDHPRVNAAWADGSIRSNPEINIGLATAVEDGLIVPVIHGAPALSIGEIASRRHDLVARANAGKLRPADISGGTFTITNLGMYNVDAFNAIVNTPQAAILAVGRIADRVVPVDGAPAVRPVMTLSLSCDHRVVDGARAARFLDDLARLIEEPWGIVAW